MYVWNNNKIRCQYDMQRVAAKNNGVTKFTDEELSVTTLKSKAFQGIQDPNVKRLIELAYVLGSLQGLETADKQLEGMPKEKPAQAEAEVKPAVSDERLYVLACKAKNRQDKIIYKTVSVKARTDNEATSAASFECGTKNQTLLLAKVLKTYTTDTMQFQFGVGKKEQDTLDLLCKKVLK